MPIERDAMSVNETHAETPRPEDRDLLRIRLGDPEEQQPEQESDAAPEEDPWSLDPLSPLP